VVGDVTETDNLIDDRIPRSFIREGCGGFSGPHLACVKRNISRAAALRGADCASFLPICYLAPGIIGAADMAIGQYLAVNFETAQAEFEKGAQGQGEAERDGREEEGSDDEDDSDSSAGDDTDNDQSHSHAAEVSPLAVVARGGLAPMATACIAPLAAASLPAVAASALTRAVDAGQARG
jgi:hypothetical protein